MYRGISKIALFIAALVLTGHTLFPHNHEDEAHHAMAVDQVAILHFLSHIFEQDLGKGHLENYLSVDQVKAPERSSELIRSEDNFFTERGCSLANQFSSFYKDYYKRAELISLGPPRSPPST